MRHDARVPLAFIRPGTEVRLALIGEDIDPVQREQLVAYGMAEGRLVRVVQQRPMTVVLADEVELALENSVARHLWVERSCASSTAFGASFNDEGGAPGKADPP